MADSAVRSGINKKEDEIPSFLLKLDTAPPTSVLSGDLHLNQAMYELALLFNMGSTRQHRCVFEQRMLAH
jgi:hypothetical protein